MMSVPVSAGLVDRLAIDGGAPVRSTPLPYGRQQIDEQDIEAVVDVLRSDWLTTGPALAELEREFARRVGAVDAVAVSSGTAALHAALHAAGVGPGNEVIVSPMTFAASANCAVYVGATPVFADVDPDTLLLDPKCVEAAITPRTKAIVAVDYAGQPCDYAALRRLATDNGLVLVADACHALGAADDGVAVGALADLSAFSFHPVKPITSGEGGIVTVTDAACGARLRTFRNHGITTDHRQREQLGSWFYEMVELGYNYRLSDIQCALALSQLHRLETVTRRRQDIAAMYDEAFRDVPQISALGRRASATHAFHLYVVRVVPADGFDRDFLFKALRAEGIGANVHYIPVHLHPYYRDRFGTGPGLCLIAEAAYEQIISLPVFPGMSNSDAEDVVKAVRKVSAAHPA